MSESLEDMTMKRKAEPWCCHDTKGPPHVGNDPNFGGPVNTSTSQGDLTHARLYDVYSIENRRDGTRCRDCMEKTQTRNS